MRIRNFFIRESELERLFKAFESGGLSHFYAQYNDMRQKNIRFHLVSNLLESFLPVNYISAEGLYFEHEIGKLGIARASREIMDRWGLEIRYEMSGKVIRVLEKESFLSFGNHSSGIESVVFDSLFDREDIYQIGASFLEKIGPNISKTAILVHNIAHKSSMQQITNKKDWRRKILNAFEAFTWPPTSDPTKVQENRTAIMRAAHLIAGNRCGVNIFPTGSVRNDAPWKNGVGSLVLKIMTIQKHNKHPIYLVPIVYGISDTHLLASSLFTPNNAARILARLQTSIFENVPFLYAPTVIPIEELLSNTRFDANQITNKLKFIWLEIQKSAALKFKSWPRR